MGAEYNLCIQHVILGRYRVDPNSSRYIVACIHHISDYVFLQKRETVADAGMTVATIMFVSSSSLIAAHGRHGFGKIAGGGTT